ncbi:MAG: glycosyltransferase family 2 protein [Candidatus Moraniibacteriota bacterium]
MNPSISFIFVNFRSAGLIEHSIQALRALVDSQITAEYLIVNNDLDEREAIGRIGLSFPGVEIIHMDRNEGFGKANNLAGNRATGEILFFINPDTCLLQANFLGLIAAFRFRPKAIYGMALTQVSGSREPWSAGVFPSLARIVSANLFPRVLPKPWEANMIAKTDWVSGAACAIRRDFFLSLGGFDETFFLYFEDVDLARRASALGGWVGVYPFLIFQHIGGQSHESQRAKKRAYYAGQQRYFEKWRPSYEQKLLDLGHRARLIL